MPQRSDIIKVGSTQQARLVSLVPNEISGANGGGGIAVDPSRTAQDATIANGETTSSVVDLHDGTAYGIRIPAAFTGTALTFQVSETSAGTYAPLYDTANAQVSLTIAAGRAYPLPAALSAWPYCKLVSGSAEAAGRTIVVVKKA